jgi:lambda family phage portal protein
MMDRAIAVVSPRWALKRHLARTALQHAQRLAPRKRFVDRADAAFGFNTGDPDDARPRRVVDRLRILRLVSEDPFAKKALNALVNNAVGWGITGAPEASAPKTVNKLWNAWVKVCDWNGRLNFYGLQELAVRMMFREGDAFIVMRELAIADGVPLRLQLLDLSMLATGSALTYATGGNTIEDGIEYDADGQIVAYHFYKGRPGQRWANLETVRMPAADVIHLFVQERVGQRFGDSVFQPVVKRLGDIDESIEAEIVREKISACLTAFVTQSDEGMTEPLGVLGTQTPNGEGYEELPETLSPGMIVRTRPGETVSFGDPKPSTSLAQIIRLALLSTAAGTGTTYEHVSGDLSNVNYSSYRAGALEFQRSIGRIQFNTIIPVALDRVSSRFQQVARERSQMPNRSYEWNWTPPPFESVDRLKDAQADQLEMANGTEIRRNLVNARGYDFDQLMEQEAADRKKLADLGLTFDAIGTASELAATEQGRALLDSLANYRSMIDARSQAAA